MMSTRKPTSEERESLGFFWELYESVREEIDEALREKALEYPEFARIARQISADELARASARSRQLQERAIFEDEWKPFIEDLEVQGASYARAEIGFRRWFELVSAFRALFSLHIATDGSHGFRYRAFQRNRGVPCECRRGYRNVEHLR